MFILHYLFSLVVPIALLLYIFGFMIRHIVIIHAFRMWILYYYLTTELMETLLRGSQTSDIFMKDNISILELVLNIRGFCNPCYCLKLSDILYIRYLSLSMDTIFFKKKNLVLWYISACNEDRSCHGYTQSNTILSIPCSGIHSWFYSCYSCAFSLPVCLCACIHV